MSLNIIKLKLRLIEYIYVLVVGLSVPVLFFRDMWYPEAISETYLVSSLFNTLSLISFCIIVASVVFIFRLNFKFAYLFGVLSTNLLAFDYVFTLRRYQLPIYSDISYFYLVIILTITSINIILVISNFHHNEKLDLMIKRLLLDFGTKYSQLEIRDISEKTSMNRAKVEKVITKMIENSEIYANYTSENKLITFKKESNIEEIDKLMEIYQKWEDKVHGKKEDHFERC